MVVNQPHFLLFTDAHLSQSRACAVSAQGFGRWHFVLERLDGPERLEAADSETDVHRDRLALLAVVRGLEALEQPSQVTLVTTSRYVSRGLRYGLNEWREAEYTWEHFGIQKPIRNADLWQRIDRAMSFHQVTCRLLQSPLAQAMVETASEMDELTVLTNPLDAPFDVVTDRANESQTAAAVARRDSAAGVIQRVDSAHGSIGLAQVTQTKLSQTEGTLKVGTGHALQGSAASVASNVRSNIGEQITRKAAAVVSATLAAEPQSSALLLPGSVDDVWSDSLSGRSSIMSRDAALITELPLTEKQLTAAPPVFRRPRISITLPNFRFRWMQTAMEWMDWWRWKLAEAYARTFGRVPLSWLRREASRDDWNGKRTWGQKPHAKQRAAIAPT